MEKKYYVVHHSAVSRNIQPQQIETINNYHKSKWNSLSSLGYYVGYNRYTEPTGKRYETRSLTEETIANIGHNCDIESRCDVISHCLGGDFSKEKPTSFQINDVVEGFREAQKQWPNIKLVQHKDIQGGRTCAELTDEYLQSWISDKTNCQSELERIKKERDIYKNAFNTLYKYITK